METTVRTARAFEELVQAGDEGPYAFSRMFSSEGRGARRRSKRAFKLLKKIDEPLRAMLREGERVSFLTSGVVQPRFLEWYFLGWAIYVMQRRAVVVTSQRILLLQIGSRGKPLEMRNQISYAAIAELKKTVLGNVKMKFRNGDSAQLVGVPGGDRKWLAKVFEQGFEAFDAIPADTGVENLCPHCYEPVVGYPAACAACRQPFKSPRTAGLLSLVFPGAGDFYLGHRFFATFEALFAAFLWAALAVAAFDPTLGVLEVLVFVGILALLMHGADAIATRVIARKGILPASGTSELWRYGVAAIIPVAALTTILLSAPGKARLRPQPVAVAGAELPPAHLDALRSAGHVGDAEQVRYFYSDGVSTVLQDGNLFTDDRIVSYLVDFDSTWSSSARFDQVVDVQVNPGAPDDALSSIYVVSDDGSSFYLIVAREGGGDRAFADALIGRWREVRAGVDGVWFDGGVGASPEDAVLIRGLVDEDEEALAGLERWWLRAWLGEEGVDWTYRGRSTASGGGVATVTIEHVDGDSQEIHFRDGR